MWTPQSASPTCALFTAFSETTTMGRSVQIFILSSLLLRPKSHIFLCCAATSLQNVSIANQSVTRLCCASFFSNFEPRYTDLFWQMSWNVSIGIGNRFFVVMADCVISFKRKWQKMLKEDVFFTGSLKLFRWLINKNSLTCTFWGEIAHAYWIICGLINLPATAFR